MNRIEKYRSSRLHRCCMYCEYCHIRLVGIENAPLCTCKAKDKLIEHPEMIRPFCSCFKVNKERCLNDDPLVSIVIQPGESEKINEVVTKLNDLINKGSTIKINIEEDN